MIAAPKGYDSKEKYLGGCGYHTDVGIVPHFIDQFYHPRDVYIEIVEKDEEYLWDEKEKKNTACGAS